MLYNDDERFLRNLQLLWILREELDQGGSFCQVKPGLLAELDLSLPVLSEQVSEDSLQNMRHCQMHALELG